MILSQCVLNNDISFLQMIILWKDPTGSNVFKSSNLTDHSITSLPTQLGTKRGKFRLVSITKVTNTPAMLKESALANNGKDVSSDINVHV